MKSALVLSTYFLSVVVVIECSVAYERGSRRIGDDSDKCFSLLTKTFMNDGERVQMPDQCGVMDCSNVDDRQYHVYYSFCGVVSVSPPCKIVRDMSKPYPDCCGDVICPPGDYGDTNSIVI